MPVQAIGLGAALLGLALAVSLWASPDRLAGLPWYAVSLTGVALVLGTSWKRAAGISRRVTPGRMAVSYIVIAGAALVVVLLTTQWPAYKWSWLNSVYGALPSIRSLPFSWAKDGLSSNQTGGILAVCTAMMAAMSLAPWERVPLRKAWRYTAATLALAGAAVVFMTGSRAALAGLAVSVLLMLLLRPRRYLWAWGSGLLLCVLGLLASGRLGSIVNFFLHDETLDTKLVARLDIWSSALMGLQDHLFTGIGLGVFNSVMPVRYPYRTVGLSYPVSQAHNLFLDIGLSLGIVGIIGLAVLLAAMLTASARGMWSGGSQGLVHIGILSALIVFLVFGITDSISFTIPTSFIIWIWAASLIILQNQTNPDHSFAHDD